MSLFIVFGGFIVAGLIKLLISQERISSEKHKKSAQQIRRENDFYNNYYLPYQYHKQREHNKRNK